ncbi:polysaccharide biosynthesis protein [Bacillus alkalicola]|uniref:Polysaccharide biosynthesis protein n=1 Tax=Evansella alkalicola TaxID=745819 RepID=A0ABS6JYU8_9BACI|nr:polysaccharide biosynthesis protein [Bacillus alkalicola]
MLDKNLLRGTAILTASIFISKILGIIYIFPFQAMVGLEGLALYTYGYNPYTIFLSLSTLGIPIAISKFISKYNALEDHQTVQRLFRSGIIVMSITGLVAFSLLFFLAEPIARQFLNTDDLGSNSISDAVFTIRMVSTALLIIPIMASIRGYFQGFGMMGPTAISQVIEQLVRIVFILVLSFLILEVWNGEISSAVGVAMFGAFVGAAGALIVLILYYVKNKDSLIKMNETAPAKEKIPLKKMYKELLSYALPISFVGLAIPLYQWIDLTSFNSAMTQVGYAMEEAEMYLGAFTQAVHKLILIPVSIATAMSLTIIPTVTKAFTTKDYDTLQKQITQTFQIILFFALPASAGLILLSDSAYGSLYSLSDIQIGGELLRYYAPVAILFSLFAVCTSLLQGIDRQKFSVIALFVGLLFKYLFNTPFITWFGPIGAVLATGVGYSLSLGIILWTIGKYGPYNYKFILKRLLLIGMFTAIMGIVVILIRNGLGIFLPLETKVNAFTILIVSTTAGLAAYMFLTIRSGLAGQILGQRFNFLKKKKQRATQ